MMIFQFQSGRRDLNSNPWAFENGYIEGDLQIVELAVQLGNWLDSVRHGVLRNFVYDSLDSEESLLQFIVQQESVSLFADSEDGGTAITHRNG